jgi:hypothetical protein
MRKPFLIAVLLLAAGCSAGEDKAAAEQAVARFHEHVDAGRFDAIYDAAAPELRQASSRRDLVALLDAVHRKLGTVQSAKLGGWHVNYGTGGHVVQLIYTTQYSAGPATEQFLYSAGTSPKLLGYNINSTTLVTR